MKGSRQVPNLHCTRVWPENPSRHGLSSSWVPPLSYECVLLFQSAFACHFLLPQLIGTDWHGHHTFLRFARVCACRAGSLTLSSPPLPQVYPSCPSISGVAAWWDYSGVHTCKGQIRHLVSSSLAVCRIDMRQGLSVSQALTL